MKRIKLIVSTLGCLALCHSLGCKDEADVRSPMCMDGQDYDEVCERFYDHGYAFYTCYNHAHLSAGGLDPDTFGIAYISKDYIQENWAKMFRTLEHDIGAIMNWQDWIVLEKV